MNYKLPILSVAIVLAIVVGVASTPPSQLSEQQGVTQSTPDGEEGYPAAAAQCTLSGQEFVAQAAYQILVAPGLEAKSHTEVEMFGQRLVGSGSYCQLSNAPKLFIKMDLKLQVGDQVRSLRQISDGDSLWEIHSQGGSQTFSHVNLGRLREEAGKSGQKVPPSFWMALGGIPRLMAKLEENFVFQTPKPKIIGKYPVWEVEGEWKPAVLAQMLPGQKEAILAGEKARLDELPEQVPHGVTLILGRDQIIPLFPYGFSFYRNEVVDEETEQVKRTAMVTWELSEVRIRPELRPSDFEFHPTDPDVQDRTEHYVGLLTAAAEKLARQQ